MLLSVSWCFYRKAAEDDKIRALHEHSGVVCRPSGNRQLITATYDFVVLRTRQLVSRERETFELRGRRLSPLDNERALLRNEMPPDTRKYTHLVFN